MLSLLLAPALAAQPWPARVRVVDLSAATTYELRADVAWEDTVPAPPTEECVDTYSSVVTGPASLADAVEAPLRLEDATQGATAILAGLEAARGQPLESFDFGDTCEELPAQADLDATTERIRWQAAAIGAQVQGCAEVSAALACDLQERIDSGEHWSSSDCFDEATVPVYTDLFTPSANSSSPPDCVHSSCRDGLDAAQAGVETLLDQLASCEEIVAGQEEALTAAILAADCMAPDGSTSEADCAAVECLDGAVEVIARFAALGAEAGQLAEGADWVSGPMEAGLDACSAETVAEECLDCERGHGTGGSWFPEPAILLEPVLASEQMARVVTGLLSDDADADPALARHLAAMPTDEVAWYVHVNGFSVPTATVLVGDDPFGPDVVVLAGVPWVEGALDRAYGTPIADFWTTAGGAADTLVQATLDGDGDGVPDTLDACRDTDASAAVGDDGCSLAQACPCAGPWRNSGAYTSCVATVAGTLRASGTLTGAEAAAAVSGAARSTCGGR